MQSFSFPPSFESELKVATELARQASATILEHYRALAAQKDIGIDYKGGDVGNPVTAADKAANTLIVEGLAQAFPKDAILAEESIDNKERLSNARLWCVDPLDGTKEFLDQNGQFVVMIGLAIDGKAAAGVVMQPTTGTLWWGADGVAAQIVGGTPHALTLSSKSPPSPPTLMISRSHRPKWIDTAKDQLGEVEEVRRGSVGLKVAAVASGEAELYVSTTDRTMEWDACGPHAIIEAAGGIMTDVQGDTLVYNKEHPNTPLGMVAGTFAYHDNALQSVQKILASKAG